MFFLSRNTVKKILIITFLLNHIGMFASTKSHDSLKVLEGKWYVNMSNFKMWLSGRKQNPTFNYTIALKHKTEGLKDVVSYEKNKKLKQIVGFDKPNNDTGTSFTWRGKGLLFLFKSKWKIVYQNDEYIIIHFKKTIATAEGFDVISRKKMLDEETMISVNRKLLELGIKTLTVIDQK